MNREEIIELCMVYGILNYIIRDDEQELYIDVEGDVMLGYTGITSIPMRFGYVEGNFLCYNNKLTSLEGCPKVVGGNFECDKNKLTSLEDYVEVVGGNFNCGQNLLLSLEGCPKEIGGNFYCHNNYLDNDDFKKSYLYLFDLGYTDQMIYTNLNLLGLRRHWFLNSIINE
jgi:hypothetical protein